MNAPLLATNPIAACVLVLAIGSFGYSLRTFDEERALTAPIRDSQYTTYTIPYVL